MARLTMQQRRALPRSDFAVPSKAPGPGSYPLNDRAHAIAAVGLSALHNSKSRRTVDAKAKKVLRQKRKKVRPESGY